MLRARRIASICVAVTLGLAGLTGCASKSDPAVAAYVGETKFLDSEITGIADEFAQSLPEEQRAAVARTLKHQTLQFLVLAKVVGEYAKEKKITLPEPDPARLAQERRVPPDTQMIKVLADYSAAMGGLHEAAQPLVPTEADKLEAYRNTEVSTGVLPAAYEDVKDDFTAEAMGKALGLRSMLTEALGDADIQFNPDYDPIFKLPLQLQLTLNPQQPEVGRSWLAVDLSGGKAAVKEQPTVTPGPPPGQHKQQPSPSQPVEPGGEHGGHAGHSG